MKILIKNGRVLNPATGTDEMLDVLVEDGIVKKMEKQIREEAERIIDAKGCYVMPGFIDLHVHLRDPGLTHKETIETGCLAAAHGGFTTILAMPNTKPVADCPEVIRYVHEKAKELGMPGITNSVEDVIIARDIVLSKETGAQLHLCHCSTEDSVKMVKLAKEEGLKVSAEVCPHHFTLTSDDIKKFVPQIENGILIPHETDADTNYKMNPPLRMKKDVEALKEGLRDNIMDVISTDHAPHTFDDKNTSMKKAPFGIVGLETAACLTYTELVLGRYLTPMQMAEKMSYNPAKIIGIDKGDIQKGKKADVRSEGDLQD